MFSLQGRQSELMKIAESLSERLFLTHTFWNGRIEWIRPLILSGLAGGIFEGF
jgi:hypothetical protein